MGVHPSGYRVCRYSKEGMSVGQVEAGGVSVKAERGGEGMQQQVQQQVEEGERVFDVNSLKAYYGTLIPRYTIAVVC